MTCPAPPTTDVRTDVTTSSTMGQERPLALGGAPRSLRATGHGRVGLGPLASGPLPAAGDLSRSTRAGTVVRLAVPLERVVCADLRLRTGTVRHALTVNAPTPLAVPATAALTATLSLLGVRTAEAHVDVRLPTRPSSGADVLEATVLAVIDAAARALDEHLDPDTRSQLATAAHQQPAAGLAADRAALVHPDGRIVAAPPADALQLVVLQPVHARGADTTDLSAAATHGAPTLPPGPANGSHLSSEELAGWLHACAAAPRVDHLAPPAQAPTSGSAQPAQAGAATADCPAHLALAVAYNSLDALAHRHATTSHLGVIGGHTPHSPVAVLFHPTAITAAQRLLAATAGRLPEGWKASMTRTPTGH